MSFDLLKTISLVAVWIAQCCLDLSRLVAMNIRKIVLLLIDKFRCLLINGLQRASHELSQGINDLLFDVQQSVFLIAQFRQEPVGFLC